MGIVRGVLSIKAPRSGWRQSANTLNWRPARAGTINSDPPADGGHINNQFQARLLRFLIIVTVTSREDGIKVEPHKIVMIMSRGGERTSRYSGVFSAPFKHPLSPSVRKRGEDQPYTAAPILQMDYSLGFAMVWYSTSCIPISRALSLCESGEVARAGTACQQGPKVSPWFARW